MKKLFIIIANLCCILAWSQEKNSSRKDFKPVENKEALKAQIQKDSLNGIPSTNTAKNFVISSQNNNPAQTIIDTTINAKVIPLNTSKKKS